MWWTRLCPNLLKWWRRRTRQEYQSNPSRWLKSCVQHFSVDVNMVVVFKSDRSPDSCVCVSGEEPHLGVCERANWESHLRLPDQGEHDSPDQKLWVQVPFVRKVRQGCKDTPHSPSPPRSLFGSPIKQLVFVTHRQPTVGLWRAYSTGWSSKLRRSSIKSARRWSTARSRASPSWMTPTMPVCEQCDDSSPQMAPLCLLALKLTCGRDAQAFWCVCECCS